VFLPDHLYAVPLGEFCRTISRAIVDNDYLRVQVERCNPIQHLADRGLLIEDGNEEGDTHHAM
jgi:hypothetical protein